MKLPAWLLPRPTTNDKAQGGKQKYVLVPPVFNRDVGFHQLAFVRLTSIADANPAYSRLFADYMTPAPRAVVLLSPPADERLTIHANVTPQDRECAAPMAAQGAGSIVFTLGACLPTFTEMLWPTCCCA
jgi:hypothetical protein